ncbi:MAG: hypothetical protein AVDCRST_MAG18-2549 [uncultured Thermomicrobiales bacterium]|uniref:Uncharacterized protein n=1 Tax=uncultured Thermomicrobiales bacterium TaxID=1645740 RepID=A0A6J4VDZ8_9BACT|nr:MAG: hypothetical protein AVDCRST_MAG18-2549 [uncultured Thermomicrobiales bacterium]
MASLKNPLLKRYWITFASPPPRGRDGFILSGPLDRLCGVTAYTLDDALYLIREQLCLGRKLPPIQKVIEDVDVASVDSGHIRPNMGEPFWRGVWWPPIDWQGYQRLRYHEPEP